MGSGGFSVLVVDDQLENALVIELYLKERTDNISVLCATSGEEALIKMQKLRPGLVLLDTDMPNQNGYQVLNKIHSSPALCHIPVVLMTSNFSDGRKTLYQNAMASIETLTKPISLQALHKLVDLFTRMEDCRQAISRLHNNNDQLLEEKQEGVLGIDKQGKIVYANHSAMRILGARPSRLMGIYLESLFESPNHHVCSGWQEHPISKICEKQTILQVDKCEFWRSDGAQTQVKFAAVPVNDVPEISMIIAFRELKAIQLDEHGASADPFLDVLTGLGNRKLLEKSLDAYLKRDNSEHHAHAGIFYLDIDHFKNINETLSHDVGDELLKAVAGRLKLMVRENDLLSRMGSDEYCILTTAIEASQAAKMARKITDAVKKPFLIQGHELYITCSMGIALFPQAGDTAHTLLTNAEIATGRAKAIGRNTFQFYNAQANRIALNEMRLEQDLHVALKKREMSLQFTPFFDIKTRLVSGFKVNLYWNHPENGCLRFADFQAIAEESGLIYEISTWMIEVAFIKLSEELKSTGVQASCLICIEISPKVLSKPEFYAWLKSVLNQCEMSSQNLMIEIPESLVALRDQSCHSHLKQLRQLGVSFSLGGFGDQYAPLTLLENIPLQYVRLSSAFINQADDEPQRLAMIECLSHLVKQLGIKLWATGVDKKSRREFLEKVGVDMGDGATFISPETNLSVGEIYALCTETVSA